MSQTLPFTKYERIMQLRSMGFNTPRMVYIESEKDLSIRTKRLEIDVFLRDLHQSFVNIRTYKHVDGKETWLSQHLTHVVISDVDKTLLKCLQDGFICMIDAENPENGIYAGNILLEDSGKSYIVEYCYRPKGGAMVRMADAVDAERHTGISKHVTLSSIPSDVANAVQQSYTKFSFPYMSVILEFAVGKEPWGVDQWYSIFWEYRDRVI